MAISLNLDKKLIFLVMAVSVIVLSVTGLIIFGYADQAIKQRAGDQLLGESTFRGETLRLLLESRVEQGGILADDPVIQRLVLELNAVPDAQRAEAIEARGGDFAARVQAFQRLIGSSMEVSDVSIIGSDGTVFFATGGRHAPDPAAVNVTEPFIGFEPSGTGKKMIVMIPIPSGDHDGQAGVVIARMGTAAVDSILLSRSGLGDTGEVYIVNDQSLMLSESRFMENAIFQTEVDTVGVRKCIDENREHVGFYPDYRGVPIYGSSYCAGDLGIVLLAEIDEEEVRRPIGALQDRIIHTGIAVTIAMGIAAFAISKSLSRPLIKLKDAANNIADGNFGVRTGIRTRDEIGELSRAFDSMAQKLQESLIEIKEKEDIIRQQEGILLKFSQHSQNDCVGVIDMKDSTAIAANLSEEDSGRVYEMFLNFMAKIIRDHGGQIVKSIGDALMFRFPDISPGDSAAIRNAIECCLSMANSQERLGQKLAGMGLPDLNYKISATYGAVRVAESTTSNMADIFGPTVNRCFKINPMCPTNSLVVDVNLHDELKHMPEYTFAELCIIEIKHKYGYEIFEVRRSGDAAP